MTQLTDIRGIGPALAHALSEHGISTPEALAAAKPADLLVVRTIGPARAKALIAAAKAAISTSPQAAKPAATVPAKPVGTALAKPIPPRKSSAKRAPRRPAVTASVVLSKAGQAKPAETEADIRDSKKAKAKAKAEKSKKKAELLAKEFEKAKKKAKAKAKKVKLKAKEAKLKEKKPKKGKKKSA